MAKAATSFLIFLGTAIHRIDANSLIGQRLHVAFCSLTNNSSTTRRTSRRILSKKSEIDEVVDQIAASESDEDMGTWNPFSLAVLKLGFTEPAWTSPYNYKKAAGTYICANCRSPLFPSSAKYDSGSGWPSFWKTIDDNRVSVKREWDGRIECKCANCGGHLGHVFPDGPTRGSLGAEELENVPQSDPKIGYKVQGDDGATSKYSRMPRFCVNGIALRFEEGKEQ